MKRNENFWSYRLQELGTPKVLRTDRWMDGRSGPITRPAFAKATQVKMKKVNKQCLLDTPRTVRVSEKTWQAIVQTRRP